MHAMMKTLILRNKKVVISADFFGEQQRKKEFFEQARIGKVSARTTDKKNISE